jgi:hypothetical protein
VKGVGGPENSFTSDLTEALALVGKPEPVGELGRPGHLAAAVGTVNGKLEGSGKMLPLRSYLGL